MLIVTLNYLFMSAQRKRFRFINSLREF